MLIKEMELGNGNGNLSRLVIFPVGKVHLFCGLVLGLCGLGTVLAYINSGRIFYYQCPGRPAGLCKCWWMHKTVMHLTLSIVGVKGSR